MQLQNLSKSGSEAVPKIDGKINMPESGHLHEQNDENRTPNRCQSGSEIDAKINVKFRC